MLPLPPMYVTSCNEPQPHSFADLQAERIYLLDTLQGENDRAMNLLRRIPPLEEIFGLTEESSIRRSAKKQLGWLKHQIKEATRQEKAILSLLGQVSREIQSREWWSQIEHERQQYLQAMNKLNLQTIYKSGQPMQFNPLPPEFQPQEMSFSRWMPNPLEPQYWNSIINNYSEYPVREYHIDEGPPLLTIRTNGSRIKLGRPRLSHGRSSMNNGTSGCLSTSTKTCNHPQRCQSNPETPSET